MNIQKQQQIQYLLQIKDSLTDKQIKVYIKEEDENNHNITHPTDYKDTTEHNAQITATHFISSPLKLKVSCSITIIDGRLKGTKYTYTIFNA